MKSEAMERNVLSWKMALAKGYKTALYAYDVNQIPVGEFDAILDFKIWSKRILAVNCYFTKIDTNVQFVATVYNNNTGDYKVPGTAINLRFAELGRFTGSMLQRM